MKSISQILKDSKTIAMVGLSNKPERDSYHVAEYMKEHGYRILPVNPSYAGQRIHGELVHATLREAADALAATGQRIDIVDCFRKAEDIPPLAREAIAVRAGCLWMQLGIENRVAADLARAAGLDVVMDQCVKVAHKMMSA
ncbi:MAG TPA: CoA-binding protein [Telluria sp.]